MVKLYVLNVLIGQDIALNTFFGGSPSQTISGRLYEHRDVWAARKIMAVVDAVFAFLGDFNHCQNSFDRDKTRRPEVL